MGSFDYTLTTRATPEQAQAYLSDLRNLQHFVRQVDEVQERRGGYAVHFDRLIGADMVVDYTVESTPGTVVATGTHDVIDATDRWEIAGTSDGTEVVYHGTYDLKGPSKLGAPFAALFGNLYSRQLAKDLTERLDALATG